MGAINFWGTDGQYKYLHKWITNTAGKPQICERADDSCKGKVEWANKSGKYLQQVNDWLRLCRSHHRRYDDSELTHAILRPKTHCKRGHEFTEETTRIVDTGRGRTAKRCMTCQRKAWRESYHRRKLCTVN